MSNEEIELNHKRIINLAIEYIEKIFSSDSTGHDVDHSLRVYQISLQIWETEKNANKFIVSLSSLLHDVDDRKLFPENKNFENAKYFLNKNNIDIITQNKIIKIINQVSFKGNESEIPDSIEGKIVQDSDRLDAIGAIGIVRAFMFGGFHNRKIYDSNEKIVSNINYEEYKKSKVSTIGHFYQKLLLLKNFINTDKGKEIAFERHKFMIRFLKQFYQENFEEEKIDCLEKFELEIESEKKNNNSKNANKELFKKINLVTEKSDNMENINNL